MHVGRDLLEELGLEEVEVEPEYADIGLDTLLGYIQELPNKYRLTFNMYVLDGYTHQEIAEMTGRAEGTCKTLLHRARKMLRERLK